MLMLNVGCGEEGGSTSVMLMLGTHDGEYADGAEPAEDGGSDGGAGSGDEVLEISAGKLPDGFPAKPVEEIVSYDEASRRVTFTLGQDVYEYMLPVP